MTILPPCPQRSSGQRQGRLMLNRIAAQFIDAGTQYVTSYRNRLPQRRNGDPVTGSQHSRIGPWATEQKVVEINGDDLLVAQQLHTTKRACLLDPSGRQQSIQHSGETGNRLRPRYDNLASNDYGDLAYGTKRNKDIRLNKIGCNLSFQISPEIIEPTSSCRNGRQIRKNQAPFPVDPRPISDIPLPPQRSHYLVTDTQPVIFSPSTDRTLADKGP